MSSVNFDETIRIGETQMLIIDHAGHYFLNEVSIIKVFAKYEEWEIVSYLYINLFRKGGKLLQIKKSGILCYHWKTSQTTLLLKTFALSENFKSWKESRELFKGMVKIGSLFLKEGEIWCRLFLRRMVASTFLKDLILWNTNSIYTLFLCWNANFWTWSM